MACSFLPLNAMLTFLDVLLTVFHITLTLFNLTGWIWKKTRKLHGVVLTATVASWFLLGIWYGWGYCPLTDWQWDIKERLGETNLPNSFIKYQADKLTGADIPSSLVDNITLGCLVGVILASLYVNIRGRKKSKA